MGHSPHKRARGKPDRARAARAIEEFLDALGLPVGEDPELRETGPRVAEAFDRDLLAGYAMDPAEILAERMASDGSELVVVGGLQAHTVCPHHLLPASGVVRVGYAPGGRVVGLGALGRLVDCFSRRLVLQETLSQQIADALVEHLGAHGAGCIAELSPTCLTARGERRHGAEVVTVATAGTLRTDPHLRAQFLGAREREH